MNVVVDGSSFVLPAKCARSVPLATRNDVKLLWYIPVTVGDMNRTSPDTGVNVKVALGTPWPVQVSVKLPAINT